jgi:hypothetical protein
VAILAKPHDDHGALCLWTLGRLKPTGRRRPTVLTFALVAIRPFQSRAVIAPSRGGRRIWYEVLSTENDGGSAGCEDLLHDLEPSGERFARHVAREALVTSRVTQEIV